MNIKGKIFIQGILIGIIMIIIFILFEKITKINVPTYLGTIIIIGLIASLSKLNK